MNAQSTPRFLAITMMIITAAAMRILPHPANFSPVAAMALFGGASIHRKDLAMLLPMLVMLLSDAALELLFGWGFHDQMFTVYLSFALITALGFYLRRRTSVMRVTGMALSASTLFFLTTNFGVWLSGGMYPKTISGLVACYVAAIPFYQSTVVGDLFYSTILFGAFALLQNQFKVLAIAK